MFKKLCISKKSVQIKENAFINPENNNNDINNAIDNDLNNVNNDLNGNNINNNLTNNIYNINNNINNDISNNIPILDTNKNIKDTNLLITNSKTLTNLSNIDDSQFKNYNDYYNEKKYLQDKCSKLEKNIITLTNIVSTLKSDINIIENKNKDKHKTIVKGYTDYISGIEDELLYYKEKYNELQPIEELSSVYLCNICLDKPKDIIMMPCSHFHCCNACFEQMYYNLYNLEGEQDNDKSLYVKCPVCRYSVEYVKSVFS